MKEPVAYSKKEVSHSKIRLKSIGGISLGLAFLKEVVFTLSSKFCSCPLIDITMFVNP